MTAALAHRGPNDDGILVDDEAHLALGFRRLSIIDTSPAGHQPMISSDGRWVIVFNGEIYNHRELRRELQTDGSTFRGHSDTEVLLEAFARWGVPTTLVRLIGMFAIALWDGHERRLTLARDRLGIKPLYYSWNPDRLLVASELKAFRQHRCFDAELDADAVALYFRVGYVPTPWSIYKAAKKLEAGCYAVCRAGEPPRITPYWDATEAAVRGHRDPLRVSDEEARSGLRALLNDAVGRRMIADVPLGAFLSGGVDSSAVVALMRAAGQGRIRTFTIGLGDETYNEAGFAKQVAAHLGTDHTELYVDSAQAQAVIPSLSDIYDEPFADSSQIPTLLISRLARADVTVALSGDGGDEVFGGYNRHLWLERIWQRARLAPRPLRRGVRWAIERLPEAAWDGFYGRVEPLLRGRLRVVLPGDKAHKLARVLDARTWNEAYLELVSQWSDPRPLLCRPPDGILPAHRGDWGLGLSDSVMLLDQLTYLPDDILTKVDRASMSVGLEVRVPLIDHRVVEWAWRLPARFKRRDGVSKWLLRQILYEHVPRALVDRPKSGFGIPLGSWLRHELRDWVEWLVDPTRLAADGWLNPGPIQQAWQAHLSGRRNWEHRLWVVVMFQAWRAQWQYSARAA